MDGIYRTAYPGSHHIETLYELKKQLQLIEFMITSSQIPLVIDGGKREITSIILGPNMEVEIYTREKEEKKE